MTSTYCRDQTTSPEMAQIATFGVSFRRDSNRTQWNTGYICATNLQCSKPSNGGCFSSTSGLEFTPLSKPFKKKEQAEKARMKYTVFPKGSGGGVVFAPSLIKES